MIGEGFFVIGSSNEIFTSSSESSSSMKRSLENVFTRSFLLSSTIYEEGTLSWVIFEGCETGSTYLVGLEDFGASYGA